jgi:hypothetical protein
VAGVLFLLLVALDFWLWHQRVSYEHEIRRLRSSMTQAEREKSDLLVRTERGQLSMALALAKRQARWGPQLHLSIAVDSGRMYLTRDGAMLRDMRVEIVPDAVPAVPDDSAADASSASHRHSAPHMPRVSHEASDTVRNVRPRGERTIQEVRTDSTGATPTVIILAGGTRIYGSNDSVDVQPGDVRMQPADFKAILPNVSPGMTVYFY